MPHPRVRIITDGVDSYQAMFRYESQDGSLVIDPYLLPTKFRAIPSLWQEIDDVIGNRKGINPVRHVKIKSHVKGLKPFINENLARISDLDYPLPWIINDETLGGLCPIPSSTLLSQWSGKAFNAFHNQVPMQFSIANFIYELKDIKGMIPKVQKSVARTASSNFLAFKFGVEPFIDDVKKMLSLTEQVNKRLQHLKRTAGKTVTLRYTQKVPETEITTPEVYLRHLGPDWQPGANLVFLRRAYNGTFTATAKLYQRLEELDTPLGTLKALAAAVGVNNPAAIVWEAIPYSFLVDWFLHLDQHIERLAIQPFGGEYRVFNTVNSVKEHWVFEVLQDFYPSVEGNVVKSLGMVEITRYMRNLGLPMSAQLTVDTALNPTQLLLSLALLEQRRK